MDFLKKAVDQASTGNKQQTEAGQYGGEQQTSSNQGGGFFDGLQNKVNNAAGGGAQGEKNEDMLDKGVDFVQEKFLGQGAQNNESALEQAKDEQISDYIRGQFHDRTGKDFPVADKDTAL